VSKVRIFGREVKVSYGSPDIWIDGAMGRCDYKNNRILINNELPEEVQHEVLVHEVIHYIDNALDLELAESQVSGLAIGVLSFIRDGYRPSDIIYIDPPMDVG